MILALVQQQRAVQMPRLTASLLRLPAQELAAELAAAAEQNPLLEVSQGRIPAIPEQGISLREHLFAQLLALPLKPCFREDALACAGEVCDGRLPGDEELARALGIASRRAAVAAELVRSLDPPGVGARDLRECLLMQLAARPAEKAAADARNILENHYSALVRRRLGLLPEAGRDAALALLATLSPRPGDAFAQQAPRAEPDLFAAKLRGLWKVSHAAEEIVAVLCRDHRSFAKQGGSWRKLRAQARATVEALKFRRRTLREVGQAVVDRQRGFFERGPAGLKPLGLADVAAATGFAVSTVSASVAGKRIATPCGVVALKYLLQRKTGGSGDMSGASLRESIKRLVAAEDPGRPLSDAQITARLAERNMVPARRTVAKHRALAGLPPACMRKFPHSKEQDSHAN